MAKEFEGYARACVLLARLADSMELRDQPIQLLRMMESAAVVMNCAASARAPSSVPSPSSMERDSLADQRRTSWRLGMIGAQNSSHIRLHSSKAVTAANATRNAVIRSWIMLLER